MPGMKAPFARDMDLVRQILFWAEHGGAPNRRPDVDEVALCYHVKLVVEAGLVEGIGMVDRVPGTDKWEPGIAHVTLLTWAGQEFLDAVRRDTIWNKVKVEAAKHGLPLVFELAKSLALGLAKESGLPLG